MTARVRWTGGAAVLLGALVAAGCSTEEHEIAPPGTAADGGSDAACDDGQAACGRACVNLLVDPHHCGSCDTSCGDQQICVDGGCICNPGYSFCPSGCTRPDSDPLNCGDCGIVCPDAGACHRGVCG